MNKILKLIVLSFIFASCSSKNAFRTTEDKELVQAVKKYQKNPEKTELKTALVQLYDAAAKLHLDKIEVYTTLTEADRWEKIIGEYDALQQLHKVVYESDIARQAVNSKDYSAEIISAKQNGANDFYQLGLDQLATGTRESSKQAYYSFKKSMKLVPNYKDANRQMDVAFESSIVKIVINPVREPAFGYNNGYGGTGYGNNGYGTTYNGGYNSRSNYSSEQFQRNLISDLGSSTNINLPARFYSDYDLRRENVIPDWEVELNWLDIDIPRPRTQQYTRNVSKQIQTGTDTSGHAVYRTVNATLTITKADFTARGDMELRITDLASKKSIAYNRFNESYTWQEEYASYRGDDRALSSNDWALINYSRSNTPQREDVIDELYRRMYSQVKSRIYTAASW